MHQDRYSIKEIYATSGIAENPRFTAFKKRITVVSNAQMKKISMLSTPSDVLCVLDVPPNNESRIFKRAIFLEGIQDPGNVGTIIRTADWFGVDVVYRSENTADFFGPKVIQATMGSFANVALATCTISDISAFTPKVQLMVADMSGQDVSTVNLTEPCCLVLGSEGKGVSEAARDLADHLVTIPGHPARLAESLNAATAGGVLCYALFSEGVN